VSSAPRSSAVKKISTSFSSAEFFLDFLTEFLILLKNHLQHKTKKEVDVMRYFYFTAVLLGAMLSTTGLTAQEAKSSPAPDWSFNATAIEACSCPMFCQCYFSTKPAAHSGGGHGEMEHFCKFNMGYKVNNGQYGDVKLDGAKFWIAGDLGGDFSTGQMDWSVVTFDPNVTKEQRDAIATIVSKYLFPVKWNSFSVGQDAPIHWEATTERAVATLAGGKTAEIVLIHNPSAMSKEPTVIKNLKYWGASRNDGFVLMPNEVQAYRAGDKPFEYKGSNGFMITVVMASTDYN
jgi:hypothetical protein